MILLLGATGYMGSEFARTMEERGIPFFAPRRSELNYAQFIPLRNFLEKKRPEFVINSAGYTGKPNVDACESNWADTLQGNTLFPAAVAQACASVGIPYGHVSSGCIYTGAKVLVDGKEQVEPNLTRPELQPLVRKSPGAIHGFTESDEPNFSFRHPPCSFYSGTKALAEEVLRGVGDGYIWRLRIPFDQFDSPRNYLSKLQNYAKVYDNVNSLSQRREFVAACLDCWLKRVPFGIYNVTNPGFVTSRQVVEMIQKILKPARTFAFWQNDEEFYRVAAKTPRSNCVLDTTKLTNAGIHLRPIEQAMTDALENWVVAAK